jgi:uncharacterized surface protein with fasciclin (FAS1) repeats
MKRSILIATATLAFGLLTNHTFAQTTPATTPAPAAATATASASGDVVSTISGSGNYAALGIALRAANLGETLKGAGPYTIFAPTNEAFSKLSSDQLDALVKDPAALATVLKYHVISGKMMKADVIKALSTGKGKATLKTIDGQTLTLSVVDSKLQLADDKGNTAQVTAFDLNASNGVVHGINGVLDAK